MTAQALYVLPVDVEDPSFLLTAVLGKVKETVPWPFPIGSVMVVVLARRQRAARSARGIPIKRIP